MGPHVHHVCIGGVVHAENHLGRLRSPHDRRGVRMVSSSRHVVVSSHPSWFLVGVFRSGVQPLRLLQETDKRSETAEEDVQTFDGFDVVLPRVFGISRLVVGRPLLRCSDGYVYPRHVLAQ